MNFDDLALGWREALLGVVVLLALYVLVVFRRLRRLRRKTAAETEAEAASEPPPAAEPPDAAPGVPAERVAAAYAKADFPWNEPPDAPAPDVRIAALEGELNRLRSEVATLRGGLATLDGGLASLREDLRQELARVNEHVQAAQHIAPIYGDAMQMALAGHDAAAIAERCGIARAEAELVVALIRNQDDGEADGQSMMGERQKP